VGVTASICTTTGSRNASAARCAPPRARRTASASSPRRTRPIIASRRASACPFDAITLGNDYELSEYNRDDMIYTKDMLLAEPIKRVPIQDPALYDTPIPYYKTDS
jgi:hypothetical protein